MLKDNYAWLIERDGEFWLVDAPLAAPVSEFIRGRVGRLAGILNTHHHGDHVGANLELKAEWGCEIFGFGADAARIPGITRHLADNEVFEILGHKVTCMHVPGHTLGHVAYYWPRHTGENWHDEANILFCGDTLFGGGCGRLFEGTAEQMFASLGIIAELPDDTLVYCAHEYTLTNLRFAMTVEPNNAALVERINPFPSVRLVRTIPTNLRLEKATNPFLRTESLEIRQNLGMESATDIAVFAELRRLKDSFS